MEQISPMLKARIEQQKLNQAQNIYTTQPKADIGGAKLEQLDKDTVQLSSKGFDYSVDDGKIPLGDKVKNFAKGLISPITAIFSSPKNFLIAAGMIAGGAALTIATGGAIAPLFVALGVTGGAVQLGKSIYKASKAATDDEAKQAWQGMGAGTSAVGMSVLGSKAALKGAGVDTKGIGFLKATLECFKQVPNSVSKSVGAFTSGEALTNLKNIFKPKKSAKAETENNTEAKAENKTEQKPESKTEAKRTIQDEVDRYNKHAEEFEKQQKQFEQSTKELTQTLEENNKNLQEIQENMAELEKSIEETKRLAQEDTAQTIKTEAKTESGLDKKMQKLDESIKQFEKSQELAKATENLVKKSYNMSAEELRSAIDKLDDTYGLSTERKNLLEGIYESKLKELQEVQNAYNELLGKADKMLPNELNQAINDRQSGIYGRKFSPEQEAALRSAYDKRLAVIQEKTRLVKQAEYTKNMETANDVVKNHMQELDKILLDENGGIEYTDGRGTYLRSSFEELVKPYDKDLGTIYHGTNAQAKASILKNGFSEDIAPAHGYKDGTGGTYFTRAKSNLYGDSVIEAEFTGKVGQANTDIINSIKILGNNRDKAEAFVQSLGQYDKSSISGEAILQQYIRQKIADMGYQGIMGTNYSATADCQYFAALDPKMIKIIK